MYLENWWFLFEIEKVFRSNYTSILRRFRDKWWTENFSKIYFQLCENPEKVQIWLNFQFLTFVIFVAEISNKHFCKLDKILRNFPSWHFFVFVTVFKKFGFEICNFKHWSCDILERYCTSLLLPIHRIIF